MDRGGLARAVLGGVAGCLFLAGCASGEVVEVNGVSILIGEPADSGNQALLTGTLESVGGCLGIDGYAVVFPHGTTVSESDPLTLEIPGHPMARLGGPASVGGGVVFQRGEHRAGDYTLSGVSVPARCAAEGLWGGFG